MISGWDDHYFDESDGLVGCNKYRYCEFIVMNCIINCAWKPKQSYLTGSTGCKEMLNSLIMYSAKVVQQVSQK